jgi:ketopantoate reductase
MRWVAPRWLRIFIGFASSGRAIGYPDTPDGLPASVAATIIENTRILHDVPESFHKPSMMLDMEKNQPIEVEVILGEVVRMAKARGVAVPVWFFLNPTNPDNHPKLMFS